MVCLGGIFVLIAVLSSGDKAHSLATAAAQAITATALKSSPATIAATEAGTVAGTEATDSGTAPANQDSADLALPSDESAAGLNFTPLPVLSVDDAQKLVTTHPDDPSAHFILALALGRTVKALKAQQELQTGTPPVKDDPAQPLHLARNPAP